ncbi:hypothetical protein [Streptomyces sp. NPDC091371]|uniref:hypothetical protein n=1 Tax=Streptomyces sp. NPDC091371 TaxID=3155303 RepID=UPI0034169B86
MARDADCSRLVGSYRPTARNDLAADLYPRLGFRPAAGIAPVPQADGDDNCVRYILDLAAGPVPDTPHIRDTLRVRP